MIIDINFIKSSEIGKRSMVLYRARRLNIEPLCYSDLHKEYLYTVTDAERIMGYKVHAIRWHNIKYYDVLLEILKSDHLKYNFELAAKKFNLRQTKVKSILSEYYLSQCFITPSKMNFEEESQDF